jgi:hypothetical protein
MKYNHYARKFIKSYYWRSFQQQEIDLIESDNASLTAYELKWNPRKPARIPKTFQNAYPIQEFHTVNPENYMNFLQ